jgi:hypothetical protein
MHGPTCIFWANLTPFSLQDKLLGSHHFRCGCDRCADERPGCLDHRIAGFSCKATGCSGCVSPSVGVCGACEARYNPQELTAAASHAQTMYQRGSG